MSFALDTPTVLIGAACFLLWASALLGGGGGPPDAY